MKFIRVIKSAKSNILKGLKSFLPQYDISQTDNWIYVSKDGSDLILSVDIDDTFPRYEILDEQNMPIKEGQYEIESKAYSKDWIKELSKYINESMNDLDQNDFYKDKEDLFSKFVKKDTQVGSFLVTYKNGTSSIVPILKNLKTGKYHLDEIGFDINLYFDTPQEAIREFKSRKSKFIDKIKEISYKK